MRIKKNKTQLFFLIFIAFSFVHSFARSNELNSYIKKDDTQKKDLFSVLGQEALKVSFSEYEKELKGASSFHDQSKHIPIEFEQPVLPIEQADEERVVEFNFDGASLSQVANQIERIFDVKFILPESIDPLPAEVKGKKLEGNKVSFRTQKPLTKQEAWNLFVTFLDLAGFAIVAGVLPKTYHIKVIDQARKSALPSYIGVHPDELPSSDEMIRYIYFIKQAKAEVVGSIVDSFKSSVGQLVQLNDLRAFILTDKSYNIKNLLPIVYKIDQAATPEAMSVLKLKKAIARDVEQLYKELVKKDDPSSRVIGSVPHKKLQTSLYFPDNVTIIAEPRSNALIILGSKEVIDKVEDFIITHVDIDLKQAYAPFVVYQVKYAEAKNIAEKMNKLVSFGNETEVGKHGGVLGGDKYFKNMTFTSNAETNTITIKGDHEDCQRVIEYIEKNIDVKPLQAAIEVLLITVDTSKRKELGAQIRNRAEPQGVLGQNVDFQTSGIRYGRSNGSPIIPKLGDALTGAKRLLGNLLNTLLTPGCAAAGTTVVNFGLDSCGVWGIFNILESIASTEVISNPFLVATNNTKSVVSVGRTRRVVSSRVVAASQPVEGYKDFKANLTLTITPQINSDGMIVLDINIENESFLGDDATLPEIAAKTHRVITTQTLLADGEVLAIGGLIQNTNTNASTKVPVLGDVPLIGWLFKNQAKAQTSDNIFALVSVRILDPNDDQDAKNFTQRRMDNYYESSRIADDSQSSRDPISRAFFKDKKGDSSHSVDDLIFNRSNTETPKDADIDMKINKRTDRALKSQKSKKSRRKSRRRMKGKSRKDMNEDVFADHLIKPLAISEEKNANQKVFNRLVDNPRESLVSSRVERMQDKEDQS